MIVTTESFPLDIWRSVLLGRYIHEWGIPSTRISRVFGTSSAFPVEIYVFPSSETGVLRLATVGMSLQRLPDQSVVNFELLLATPDQLENVTVEDLFTFMTSLIQHGLQEKDKYAPNVIIPNCPDVPAAWRPSGILFDTPMCESEELASFSFPERSVRLLWVVPIYQAEIEFVRHFGIQSLFDECQSLGWHPADPRRPCMVAEP
jgi:hypothetical protein